MRFIVMQCYGMLGMLSTCSTFIVFIQSAWIVRQCGGRGEVFSLNYASTNVWSSETMTKVSCSFHMNPGGGVWVARWGGEGGITPRYACHCMLCCAQDGRSMQTDTGNIPT